MKTKVRPLAVGHLEEELEVVGVAKHQRLTAEVVASYDICVLVGKVQIFKLGDLGETT